MDCATSSHSESSAFRSDRLASSNSVVRRVSSALTKSPKARSQSAISAYRRATWTGVQFVPALGLPGLPESGKAVLFRPPRHVSQELAFGRFQREAVAIAHTLLVWNAGPW